ncbi:MAG: HD domain-containing protein [Planctomycetota bacterium]
MSLFQSQADGSASESSGEASAMTTAHAADTSASSGRRMIRDFSASELFEGAFRIANAQLGRTRTDKPYLKCLLGDQSGEAPGRMWNISEQVFRRLPTDGFVYARGETQPYQGEIQLIIHEIDPHEPTGDQLVELMPAAERPIDEMFREVLAHIDSLEHPAIKALAQAYLDDAQLMAEFKTAPAAKMMHHAYIGGLLEHTLSLMNLAHAVCPNYPDINRDLVMLGLFLHDLGKTRELSWDGAFAYTDRGELIGHIVEGAIMLHDKSQQVMRSAGVRFPAGAITVLQHIILSHHGIPEYGAAKVPSTPEAILISHLDDLDAKTHIALAMTRGSKSKRADLGGNFTEKQWSLGTKLYRPDPLKPAQG